MNSARIYLRTAVNLTSRSEEPAITAVITELEITIISIRKSDILREKSREFISKSSNQDIYTKLDKIIEKLNESGYIEIDIGDN